MARMIKLERKWLMAAAIAMAAAMILYTLAREAFGFSLGVGFEKSFFDIVFVVAIAIVILNRKLAADEKKSRIESRDREPGDGGDPAE